MPRRSKASWITVVVMSFAGANALFLGCSSDDFQCGLPVDGSEGTIRRCDRALEVCVCATNSCARRVPTPTPKSDSGTADSGTADSGTGDSGVPDAGPQECKGTPAECCEKRGENTEGAGECCSGYMYVDAPFARDGIAGKCVPVRDLMFLPVVPNDDNPGPACPGVEAVDAGEDSSPDSSMDSGPSSGGAGGSPDGSGGNASGGAPPIGGQPGSGGANDGGSAGAGMAGMSSGGIGGQGGAP